MPQRLHTVLVPSQALAAGAENFAFDLPVNPLSAITFSLRALNETAVATTFMGGATELMSKISNIRARYRGATIFDGDPLDLVQVCGRYSGWWPAQGQLNRTDNNVRSLSWAHLFGHHWADPKECFPATRRGDFVLEVATAADPAGFDGYTLQIETDELLDAAPERFLKITSSAQALAAGDVNDLALPIGNKLLGILLRAGLFPTGASNNAGYNEVSLEVDNVEVVISTALWRALHAEWAMRTRIDWMLGSHSHGFVDAAAGQTDTQEAWIDSDAMQRYGFIDLDPKNDNSMGLETRGAADINLHVNASAADAAARIIVVENVETGAAPAA